MSNQTKRVDVVVRNLTYCRNQNIKSLQNEMFQQAYFSTSMIYACRSKINFGKLLFYH